jgi:ankyrin repeat protein
MCVAKLSSTGSELERNTTTILRKLILDSEDLKLNLQDEGGNTALHYATVNGDYPFAQTLIHRNADVNILNSSGVNPVHLAAAQNNVQLSLLFLRSGAQLMIPTKDERGKLAADLTEDLQLKMTFCGLKNSYSHPLTIKYMDLSFFNARQLGTLGITMCPGRKIKLWSRDIFLDLQALQQAKCNTLVSCITRKELTEMGLTDYVDCVRNANIEAFQISIANNWIPNSTDDFLQLVRMIAIRLLEGKNVVVHCDNGTNRSSLFIGSVMVQLGLPAEKAKQVLRTMSEDYLNNPAQQIYLSNLKFKAIEITDIEIKNDQTHDLDSEASEKEEKGQETKSNV